MSRIKIATAVVINLLLIGLCTVTVNKFLGYKNYTLYTNGKWENTKTSLAKVTVGAWSMMCTKAAVSQNQLNIADWLGYQELIYKNSISFRKLRFSCVGYNHCFSFILNKTDSLTQGICFNFNNDSTCFFFIADHEGRFLHKEIFSAGNALNNTNKNQVAIERTKDSVFVKINNRQIAEVQMPLPSFVHLGFRGGHMEQCVYVDDIVAVDERESVVMMEDFSPPFSFHWISLLVLWVLSGSFLFLFKPHYTIYTVYLNLVICLALAACYYIYFNHLSGRYQRNDPYFEWLDRNWHGVRATFEYKTDIDTRLNRDYPVEKIAGIKPVVLFIGSSQTWGQGVSADDKAMPARVQQNLRNYFRDTTITVINCGVPGANADSLLSFYKNQWGRYLPLITVINLSHNDPDTTIFKKSIRDFIAFNKSKSIKTVLIPEANDRVYVPQQTKREIMKGEGLSEQVKVLEVQTFMDTCYETGFMWWDIVHCTDYGYKCLADRISPALIDLMKEDSSLNAFRKRK